MKNIPLRTSTRLYPSIIIGEDLGYFHHLAVLNNVAVNIDVKIAI